MVQWTNLDPPVRKKYRDDNGKAHDVSPLRFVCGCQNGHIQDIPWRWIVHGETKCGESLWLEEAGTSGDPRDTKVLCRCGKSLLLEQLFQAGRLGLCHGERPWIGTDDPTPCKDDSGQPTKLRLLTRSATNAYFPQVATVISLPEADDTLGRIIAEHLTDLREVASAAEVGMARKFNQGLRAALEGYSDEAIFARVQQLKSGDIAAMAPDPRVAEYELLASGRALIGEDSPDTLLHATTLPRSAWDKDGDPLLEGIEALVAVHRLREVVCLYGFTRFEGSPPMSDDGLEDIGIAVRGAPLGSNPDWLPAIQQHGEGLFLQIDARAVDTWLGRTNTQKSYQAADRRVRELGEEEIGPSSAQRGVRAAAQPVARIDDGNCSRLWLPGKFAGGAYLRAAAYQTRRPAPLRAADLHSHRRHSGHPGRLGRGRRPVRDGAAWCFAPVGGVQQ